MTTAQQISTILEALVQVADDAFVVCDKDGITRFVNPAVKALFGYEPQELLGKPISILIPTELQNRHTAHMEAFRDGPIAAKQMSEREPISVLCKGGGERPVRAPIQKMQVDGEWVLAAVVRDALVDTEARRRLQELADTEPLTGILNRRGFLRVATEKIARARGRDHPMSVAVLDLDHLKKINDTHGHAVGDAVITRIARVITKCIREADAAGRLGGDEFVILFDGAGVEIAERACERIRDELRDSSIRLGDAIVEGITLSGGISGIVGTDQNIDAALARADSLMYSAKQMGRNTVHTTA